MRKKIMAFVFAAGLLMALAVPLVGSGAAQAVNHGHAGNSVGNVAGDAASEAARGDLGSDGAESAADIAFP